jgi:phage shock protein A
LEDELAQLAADAGVNDELEKLKERLGNRMPQKDPLPRNG